MASLAQLPRPVPRDRGTLSTADWFPYVFSKLAPLEGWNVILSADDIRRDRYPSAASFERDKNDTYVIPRFCFELFRVSPELYGRLYLAVEAYRGPIVWSFLGRCLGAFTQRPGYVGFAPAADLSPDEFLKKMEEARRNPPKPDPEFVSKAIEDIPRFCEFIESQLELTDKDPLDFDKKWLTREGLQGSRGINDDFMEPGDRMPTLARTFDRPAVGIPSEKLNLSFGVSDEEISVLLTELGADYGRADSSDPVAAGYPLLSRLSDITMSAIYRPNETNSLLAEVARAQSVARKPSSIRALDKLYRIAKWAEKYEDAIYFGGQ